MVITAILLMGVCLSSISPITPVSSKGLSRDVLSQLYEPVNVCDSPTISGDVTWDSTTVYQVPSCVVTVASEATLTIEAGTVVQFGSGISGMIISGTLIAIGTDASPVVFTSINDNSDTSGSDAANPGDWWGIVLREGSVATFDYTHIRYAGSDLFQSAYADPMNNSGYNRAQLDVRNASLAMNHSEIVNGEATGLFLDGVGITPLVQNSEFSNNTIDNDAYNVGAAIQQKTINMQPTFTNLTFSGNTRDRVVIPVGTLSQDVTLGGAPLGFTCGSNACPITVVSPHTLTIQRGADLDMTTGYLVYFLVKSGGTLSAIGSESDPISFFSGQFRFEAGSNGQLSHCEIDGNNFGGGVHGLIINTEGVSIENSTIKN